MMLGVAVSTTEFVADQFGGLRIEAYSNGDVRMVTDSTTTKFTATSFADLVAHLIAASHTASHNAREKEVD